jgi:hypothetical protein
MVESYRRRDLFSNFSYKIIRMKVLADNDEVTVVEFMIKPTTHNAFDIAKASEELDLEIGKYTATLTGKDVFHVFRGRHNQFIGLVVVNKNMGYVEND